MHKEQLTLKVSKKRRKGVNMNMVFAMLGTPEILMIAVVLIFLVLIPKKLPEIIRKFRVSAKESQDELKTPLDDEDDE